MGQEIAEGIFTAGAGRERQRERGPLGRQARQAKGRTD